jgi:lipopolysaccharide exporter
MTDIARRVAKGATWMLLLRLATRGTGLISTIILARLLLPGDFGLVALGSMLREVTQVLGEFSFGVALIANRNADRPYYDTAWTLTVVKGVASAVVLSAIAYPAAGFFEEPRLVGVLYVLAFGAVIDGLQNIGIVQFLRDLEFDKNFYVAMIGRAGSFFVTILCAFLWRDYRALLAGILTGKFLSLCTSYYYSPYRPRFSLSRWRSLLGFSKWLLLGNLLNTVNSQADAFVLGKLVNASTLGVYRIAFEISNLATSELVVPLRNALLPGFAHLADDRQRLGRSFLDSLAVIVMVAAPLALGIGLTAPFIVQLALGPKWSDAIPLMRILAFSGLLWAFQANTGTILMASGLPRSNTKILAASFAVFVPALLIGIPAAGAAGAAWATVLAAGVSTAMGYRETLTLLGLPVMSVCQAIWRSAASCVAMAVVVSLVENLLGPTSASLGTAGIAAVVVASGALSYFAVHLGLWAMAGRPDGAELRVYTLINRP